MDASTFDLTDIFTGNSFPKEDVTVVVNEALTYELGKIEKEIQKDPENASLERKRKALVKKAKDATFTFHLTGVPRQDILAALDAVEEEYPSKETFGRKIPHPKADDAYAVKSWAMHIESIENGSGGVVSPITEEQAAELRGSLPTAVVLKVETAINDLAATAREGFEALALETDFLSKR